MWHTRDEANRALRGGVVAGIVAGIAVALILTAVQVAGGHDVWMSFKGAGAPFLHQRAMAPGFDPIAVIVGVVCQFAVSLAWGVPFGLLAYGMSRPITVLFGAFWGLIVWIGMYYVVLPILGLGAMAAAVPVPFAVTTHVIFGLALAFGFMPFQETHPHGRHAFR
jgi:hypothetical protein